MVKNYQFETHYFCYIFHSALNKNNIIKNSSFHRVLNIKSWVYELCNQRHTKYLTIDRPYILKIHCVKSVRIRSCSGPYFLAFGLHAVNECGKIQSEYSPNAGK